MDTNLTDYFIHNISAKNVSAANRENYHNWNPEKYFKPKVFIWKHSSKSDTFKNTNTCIISLKKIANVYKRLRV